MRNRRVLIVASGTATLLFALMVLPEAHAQSIPTSTGSQLGPTVLAAVAWLATGETIGFPDEDPFVAQSQATGFVGDEECRSCHPDQGDSYDLTKHSRELDERTPAGTTGCESCHGPGEAHMEDGDVTLIKQFQVMTSSEVSDVCTTCHNRGEHTFWEGSQHDGRDLTCTNCHSVHDWKSEKSQLKEPTQIALCGQCHADKAAKMQRANHMPVREGKLECSSCHNPHGSANVMLIRMGTSMTANDACTTCHAEKRGPFLWEHAPVQENCASCHDPHGSSNDRMLVAKQPMLCQRCHAHTRHPATIYDDSNVATSSRAYGRACVNCHQTIHGSNHPSGKFFQR